MSAVNICLPNHRSGDHWPGISSIGPILINGAQPDADLARVQMLLKHVHGDLFRLDSESDPAPDAAITIDNAETWAASIPALDDFLTEVGKWTWEMKFFKQGQEAPLTLYVGQFDVIRSIAAE